jgi:FkbM family methyltransferase
MSIFTRIKRRVARAVAAPAPPQADLTTAYRVLSGGRGSAERLAALREQQACVGWDEQGVLLTLLVEPVVAENLHLADIARAMYECHAVAPLATHFGATIFGYPCDHYVYGTIKRTGRWEPHVESFLRRWCEPGALAVDVGANCGYFSALLCHLVGPTGAVHAFEPAAHMVAALERTRAANGYSQLHIHRAAAGEAGGTITLHIDLINAGGNQVMPAGFAVDPNRYLVAECPVVALDDALADRTRPVSVMKVDVEGFEASVMRGASELVRRDRPALCVEFGPEYMRTKGADPCELVQQLIDAAYEFAFHDGPAPAGLTAARVCEHVARAYTWTELFATPRPAR